MIWYMHHIHSQSCVPGSISRDTNSNEVKQPGMSYIDSMTVACAVSLLHVYLWCVYVCYARCIHACQTCINMFYTCVIRVSIRKVVVVLVVEELACKRDWRSYWGVSSRLLGIWGGKRDGRLWDATDWTSLWNIDRTTINVWRNLRRFNAK